MNDLAIVIPVFASAIALVIGAIGFWTNKIIKTIRFENKNGFNKKNNEELRVIKKRMCSTDNNIFLIQQFIFKNHPNEFKSATKTRKIQDGTYRNLKKIERGRKNE